MCLSCVPPTEGIRQFDSDTPMGVIQKRGALVAGIDIDSPPFGSLDPEGRPVGFTVDLARHLARGLGVELRLIPSTSDALLRLVDGGQVDVAFPSLALSEEWLRTYAPSDPYWVAHQRLLVDEGSDIVSFDDLEEKKVCAVLQPDVGVDPALVHPGAETVEGDDQSCLARLRAGDVDAVTASDYMLIEMRAREPGLQIVGEKITAEGFGAFVMRRQAVLTDYVNKIFVEVDETAWEQSYREWIVPVVPGDVPDPPTMTAEEAGALYPIPT